MAGEEIVGGSIRAEIIRRLRAAEAEHDVRILYACESGSRAWGFASPDSDYDVRFIYVRKPDWYMAFDIERRRDVIEYPILDEIDCGGWDLRKALYLLTRTNGALLEWINSPIRYIDVSSIAQSLREIAPNVMSPVALCYHYSHMARGNAREHIYKEQVRLKKYFYVLRPLLAIRYIEQGMGIPPVEFARLVEAVAPESLRQSIERLLALKRQTEEFGYGAQVPEINQFIEHELARHGAAFSGQGRPSIVDKEGAHARLNDLFRAAVRAGAE
ncbi:MAG: nucleotidyltransferase domain-containing protein [Methylococcaceae bacterium]|nr:nucleotidyltransferase domain-containing protein [Methylococcaceae bacterium]